MTNHYELLYIVSVKFAGAELEKIQTKVKELIQKEGGQIDHEEDFGKKKLAYPIKHNYQGFYIINEFDIEADKVKTLNEKLKLTSEVLRYLIVSKKKLTEEEKKNKENKKQKTEEESNLSDQFNIEKQLDTKPKVETKEDKETKPEETKTETKKEKKEDKKEETTTEKKENDKIKLDDLDKKLDEIIDSNVI